MKRKIYAQVYILIILAFIIILSGCNKLLDVTPENKKTASDFWQVKGEVEAAMVGCYSSLQTAMKRFFVWGEVRGEIIQIDLQFNTISLGTGWTNNQGMYEMNSQAIDDKNPMAQWGDIYTAINRLNTVIAYAPGVQQKDATFSRKELGYYIGECKALRALCYFYLARTFYQFPYITQASLTDQQNYQVKPLNASQVMDSITSELLSAEKIVRSNFDTIVFSDPGLQVAYDKGRITLPAVRAILADVYLTNNNYAAAEQYAGSLIDFMPSAQYQLVSGANWFSIFSPGNSSEGIFELQFSQKYSNPGDFAKWFSNVNGGVNWFSNHLNKNTETYKYWEGNDYKNLLTNDIRGAGNTYVATNGSLIWKWAGLASGGSSTNARDGNSWDAHYIFYRYADIILMEAEALNRLNRSRDAAQMLLVIRQRAGYTQTSLTYSSVEDLEDQILDERARELAFEGKRWFDLVRIAKRRNDYTVIAKRLADFWALPNEQSVWYAKVSDPMSWYMPIYYTELTSNVNLVQNPFYKH